MDSSCYVNHATKSKRIRREKMPGRRWTEAEIALVNEMGMRGISNQTIADALNRTPQAVANKKISIRDPDYYLRAQAKAEMDEAHALNELLNEEEGMKQPDFEAIFIVLMGFTVFGILTIGAILNAGSGL
jgi:hypothetical protein